MPNYCTASAVVRGYRDNVDEFMRIMKADYNYHTMEFSHVPHFYRIFEVYEEEPEYYGLEKIQPFTFECAWSVYSCMFDGPMSYYNSNTTINKAFNNMKKSKQQIHDELISAAQHIIHSSHVVYESCRLGLYIEIISTEPGMGFSEHYLINQGIVCINEENEYREYYLRDCKTKEDYEKEYGKEIPLTEKEYKELSKYHDCYIPDEDLYYIDDDNPIYANSRMVSVEMCRTGEKIPNQEFTPSQYRDKDDSDIAIDMVLRNNKELANYYTKQIIDGKMAKDEVYKFLRDTYGKTNKT